jgi:hypothetical protein
MNDAIDSASNDDILHGQRHVDDPCIKIVETLLVVLRWCLLIRSLKDHCSVSTKSLKELNKGYYV